MSIKDLINTTKATHSNHEHLDWLECVLFENNISYESLVRIRKSTNKSVYEELIENLDTIVVNKRKLRVTDKHTTVSKSELLIRGFVYTDLSLDKLLKNNSILFKAIEPKILEQIDLTRFENLPLYFYNWNVSRISKLLELGVTLELAYDHDRLATIPYRALKLIAKHNVADVNQLMKLDDADDITIEWLDYKYKKASLDSVYNYVNANDEDGDYYTILEQSEHKTVCYLLDLNADVKQSKERLKFYFKEFDELQKENEHILPILLLAFLKDENLLFSYLNLSLPTDTLIIVLLNHIMDSKEELINKYNNHCLMDIKSVFSYIENKSFEILEGD